jgi:ferric enterobactin receptor
MNRLFLLLALLITNFAIAQAPAGAPPAGMPPMGFPGKGPMATGRVYGKLVDANGRGIDFASVLILKKYIDSATHKEKTTLIKGVNSESNGDFSFDEVPLNVPIRLTAAEIGYVQVQMDIMLSPRSMQQDLGNIKMSADTKQLKEATITATKSYMSVDAEKKVFNVAKDVVSAGGNGLDVLKNVPGVNVDLDGNISVRGGAPQLFIDGKPTTLTLDQVPADAIESIEVINNPSAKYDASGGGTGILNVVLKKNRKSGYNGSIRAGADSYGGTNGGASFNVNQGKFNFSADLNARSMRDLTKSSLHRTDESSSPTTVLDQYQRDTNTGGMYFGKIGLDYFMTNRTTLSLTGFAMHHGMDQTSDIDMYTNSIFNTGTTTQYSQETINSTRSFNGRGGTLGMKHLFKKDKETLTADVSYFGGKMESTSEYVINSYTSGAGSALAGSDVRKINGGGDDKNVIIQSDFSNPIGHDMTLEAGVRAAMQSRLNTNDNYVYSTTANDYELIPAAASNYKSQNNVYAAYATLAGKKHNFSYKAGLRTESSNYSGTLLNSGQTFSNKYPVSLFPSLFLGQKIGNGQELQFSYSRRVNRPNFFQLIPYTDSSNKLNITRGNPDLVPEFTQSFELSYMKSLGHLGMVMASGYYKYTDHLITGYIEQDVDAATGTTTIVNTYTNAKSSYSLGSEITGQFNLAKWWDITGNVNIYHAAIDLGNSSATYQQIDWSWFGKINSNFRLPAGFSLQLTGSYQSKTNLPVNTNSNQPGPPNMQSQSASQGYIQPFYEVNIAAKKMFLDNKIAVSLSLNDMFRSHVQNQYTYSDYFSQNYERLKNPQMLRLNVSYNFGKLDASLFQRKNNNVQTEEQ